MKALGNFLFGLFLIGSGFVAGRLYEQAVPTIVKKVVEKKVDERKESLRERLPLRKDLQCK